MQHLRRATLKIDSFLTLPRVTFYPLVLLIIVSAFYGRYLIETRGVNGGLSVAGYGAHMIGGHIVLEGNRRALYDLEQQARTQNRILAGPPVTKSNTHTFAKDRQDHGDYAGLHFYVAPPFVAYLYAPFAALPYMAGVLLWTMLTVALLISSLRLLWPLVPNLHRYGFARVLLVAFSTAPALLLLAAGQDAAISLFLLVLGLRLLLADHDLSAGAVLGLGVFKPQFFMLVPVLLVLQRRWRALGAWSAVAALLAGMSLALVGLDGARAYVDLLASDLYHVRVDVFQAKNMLSLIALIRSLGFASLVPIVGGISALLLAVGFGASASKPIGRRGFTLLYAATILMTVIITPHALVYDGVVLFIPALILLNEMRRSPVVRLALAAAYVLIWLFPLHFGIFGVAPWTVVPLTVLLLVSRRLLLVPNTRELLGQRSAPSGTASVQPG